MIETRPYIHTVNYYETDRMGITHHSNYIRFMEEARVDFLEQIGYPYDKLEEMGVISPVTAVECKYKATTTFADKISISVWVEEFKGVRLKIGYLMKNEEGKTVFEGHSEHCFLTPEGKLIRVDRQYPEMCKVLQDCIKAEE